MIDGTTDPVSLLLVVAAALVNDAGRVLIAKRPAGTDHAGLWEFPGGKVEPGERPEAALIRELREELNVVLHAAALSPIGFASVAQGDRQLVLLLYRCDRWEGEPVALQADELAWKRPIDLAAVMMPPADQELAAMLVRTLNEMEMEARAGIEPACKDLQSSA